MSDENKRIIVGGSLTPSTKNTPIDARTRVSTLEDIPNIQLPYIGMIFFVMSEGKHFVVRTLKEKNINGIIVEDALVDQYSELEVSVDLSGYATTAQLAILETKIDKKVDAVEGKGLSTNDLTDELVEKINASDANILEIVKVNGTPLQVADDKSVDIVIPVATDSVAGLVKSSTAENKVAVAEDGTMEVGTININKIVQTEGDTLILNGGAAGSF